MTTLLDELGVGGDRALGPDMGDLRWAWNRAGDFHRGAAADRLGGIDIKDVFLNHLDAELSVARSVP